MSFWDYVLPWKAIPNMVKDVKKAATTTEGKGKYDSVFGAIGKYADPGGALLGDKWMDFWHGTVPREANRAIQPWNEFHMKYLDPIQMAYGDELEPMGTYGKTKGADLTAAALAATIGGMATGGFGLGGGSGGSGGSSMPWSQNWSAMDWSNPNTYMQLGQQYGGMMPQGQQQQAYQPPPQQGLLTDPEEERKRREREYLAQLQNYGYSTYGLLG